MHIQYSGSGIPLSGADSLSRDDLREYLNIDNVSEDIVMLVLGGPPSSSEFHIRASWDKIGDVNETVEELIENK